MLKHKHFPHWRKRDPRKKVTISGSMRTEKTAVTYQETHEKRWWGGGRKEGRETHSEKLDGREKIKKQLRIKYQDGQTCKHRIKERDKQKK